MSASSHNTSKQWSEPSLTDGEEDQKSLETEPHLEIKTEIKPFKRRIVWFNAIGFLVLHLFALYGFWLSFWSHPLTVLWSFSIMVFSGLSVTMGAHRLWSHKSYKAVFPLKMVLLVGQTIAGQNCLWVWVRDHRQHHKYSDTDGDPHNASNGFFFSHIGWLMSRKHPEVIAKGKLIDMSDLDADPWIIFQKTHYKKLYTLFAIVIPTAVPVLLWNESLLNSFMVAYLFRNMLSLNLTWLVNSWAHIYGYRPFSKDILPVDSLFVSQVGLGEGWHNYHHTFPWDYRAAEIGSPYNMTRRVLEACAKMGWVYDLKAASEQMVAHRVLTRGDGTYQKQRSL